MGDEVKEAPSRVRMAEIAAAAGVSVPTVSKVVNGRVDVSPGTRRRIQELLAEAGYARSVPRRDKPSGLIDLVFTEFSEFATEILRGAEETAREGEVRVAVTTASTDAERDRWLSNISATRTDGVILVLTELSPRHRKRLAALHVPVVIVDPVGQPDPAVPSIGAANWAGGLAATEHLIGLGHRRIGTITGRPSVLCSQARLDGYGTALARAGIPADPALVAIGDFHYESALAAALSMLDLPDPPTAIFAASDLQALGVYEAARKLQLRVPDDLSVVGFDDVPMARWLPPALTTMRQPLAEMAALAVRTLREGDSADFNHRVELSTNLVVRSSTGPPAVRRRAYRPSGAATPATPARSGREDSQGEMT
jgi:DNA-binding LacI/PurR family transcriptional regulator